MNPQPDTPSPEPEPARPTPWWRVGMVWMVIGGPAIVVVAAISTAMIAYRGADEVLQAPPEVAQKQAARPDSDSPAMHARNHAATAVDN